MSLLETIHLEHLPLNFTIHVALFSSIENAAFLHQQLLAGNSDFEYAFIDASIIVSRLHVLAAAFRAVNDSIERRLKSQNVHAEIVLSLSPSNNISESFRRFGLTSTSTSILAVKVSTPSKPFTSEAVQAHLASSIVGQQLEFTDAKLEALTDIQKVRKYYKLNVVGGGSKKKLVNGTSGGAEPSNFDEKKELELGIIGGMALRGVS